MSRRNIGAEMTKLVALYKESGQSQKEFAVSHGVSEGKLHYWITKISKPEKVKPVSKKVGFVPIEVAQELRWSLRSCHQ